MTVGLLQRFPDCCLASSPILDESHNKRHSQFKERTRDLIGDSVREELGFETTSIDGVFLSADAGRGRGSSGSDGRGSRVDSSRAWNGKSTHEMGLYMGHDEGSKGNVDVAANIKGPD